MRIRKHAGRILSSLSIPTQSRAVAAATVTAGGKLEMHVCELNQSPWDVMAFTPPGFFVPLYHHQVPVGEEEEVDEGNGFAWEATGIGVIGRTAAAAEEEPAATVPVVSGSTPQPTVRRAAMTEGAEEDEEKRERKMDAKKRRNTDVDNTKRIKRKTASSGATREADDEQVMKTEEESSPTAAAAAAVASSSTCKKSDGKGWHCKRVAQHPHSLCGYHLVQVRSYHANGDTTTTTTTHILPTMYGGRIGAKQDAALIQDKKSIKKSTRKDNGSNDAASRRRRKPSSDFFYYYSGFGPWRGKRGRGGGHREERETGNVDARNGHDHEGDGGCDGLPPPMVHDQAPEDLDDEDEDEDEVEDGGEELQVDDVVGSSRRWRKKKRGRKPVKARSLKSLL